MEHFDPLKHKRGVHGKFSDMLASLKPGSAAHLPDGIHVKAGTGRFGGGTRRGYQVHGANGEKIGGFHAERSSAAMVALNASAKNTHPDSIGGTKSHENFKAAEQYAAHGTSAAPKPAKAASLAHGAGGGEGHADNLAAVRKSFHPDPAKARQQVQNSKLPQFQKRDLHVALAREIAAKNDAKGRIAPAADRNALRKMTPDEKRAAVKRQEEDKAGVAGAGAGNKPKAGDLALGGTLHHDSHGEMVYMGRNSTNHHVARKAGDGEGGKKHIIRLKNVSLTAPVGSEKKPASGKLPENFGKGNQVREAKVASERHAELNALQAANAQGGPDKRGGDPMGGKANEAAAARKNKEAQAMRDNADSVTHVGELDRAIQAKLAQAPDLAAKNKLYKQYREWAKGGAKSPAIKRIEADMAAKGERAGLRAKPRAAVDQGARQKALAAKAQQKADIQRRNAQEADAKKAARKAGNAQEKERHAAAEANGWTGMEQYKLDEAKRKMNNARGPGAAQAAQKTVRELEARKNELAKGPNKPLGKQKIEKVALSEHEKEIRGTNQLMDKRMVTMPDGTVHELTRVKHYERVMARDANYEVGKRHDFTAWYASGKQLTTGGIKDAMKRLGEEHAKGLRPKA